MARVTRVRPVRLRRFSLPSARAGPPRATWWHPGRGNRPPGWARGTGGRAAKGLAAAQPGGGTEGARALSVHKRRGAEARAQARDCPRLGGRGSARGTRSPAPRWGSPRSTPARTASRRGQTAPPSRPAAKAAFGPVYRSGARVALGGNLRGGAALGGSRGRHADLASRKAHTAPARALLSAWSACARDASNGGRGAQRAPAHRELVLRRLRADRRGRFRRPGSHRTGDVGRD